MTGLVAALRGPYVDERSCPVDASVAELWGALEVIGGDHDFYGVPLVWPARGLADRLVGGVGMRRGRADPATLRVGDPLDFWRIEEVVPGRLLRLRAEMRLPGEVVMDLLAQEQGGRTVLAQRLTFSPSGVLGRAYWWSVLPFHGVVFRGMMRSIRSAAEQLHVGREAGR